MADSNITVTNLVAVSGIGMLILTWGYDDPNVDGLPYLRLAGVEVHAATSNNRALAVRVADGVISAIHAGVAAGSDWYFWIKPRNNSGQYGEWFPLSPTAGIHTVAGVVTASEIDVDNLAAISADLGTISAGTINGVTINGTTINSSNLNNNSVGSGNGVVLTATSGRCLLVAATTGKTIEANATTGFAMDANGSGTIGVRSSVGIGNFSFYASGGSYGPFTGAHDALLPKGSPAAIGDVVCDVAIVAHGGVSNAIATAQLADSEHVPALGVLSALRPLSIDAMPAALELEQLLAMADEYDHATVNAVGEGLINVCGAAGRIAAGDLLVTSAVSGRAMRQADDIVRSYTVARAREAANVNKPGDQAQIACIYLCG